MGSATSKTGIFSWGNYIKDHVGGDLGRVLGVATDVITAPASSVTEPADNISAGWKKGGVMGGLGSFIGSAPMTSVAPIMSAFGQEKYLKDASAIAQDVTDPLNLFPGGWMDEQAEKEAVAAAEAERLAQNEAFANANILGITENIKKKRQRKSGLGTSIFGGESSDANYKSLLGV